MLLTLDLALIRWAVVCGDRERAVGGSSPSLGPFLAGWFLRDMGATCPERDALGVYVASFRAGWKEADSAIRIRMREVPHEFAPDSENHCKVCDLVAHHHNWEKR